MDGPPQRPPLDPQQPPARVYDQQGKTIGNVRFHSLYEACMY